MGVLLPQGYTLHSDRQFPWICPVRSCRNIFAKLGGLGSHFVRMHNASLFNDNGDGTLSIIGKAERVAGKMSASVASKKPLDPKEASMVKPSLPSYRSKESKEVASTSSRRPMSGMVTLPLNYTSMLSSATGEAVLGKTGMGFWKYIQSKLTCTPLFPIPQKGHVPQLLEHLSRVRNIRFNTHGRPFKEAKGQDISAMIVQVAGTQAKVSCSRCKMGKGPFKGCYVIPASAPLSVRQSILGCANCYYQHNQTYCDLKGWSLETYPELGGTRWANKGITALVASTAKTVEQGERRSMRVACQESLAESVRDSEVLRRDAHSSKNEQASNKADIPSLPSSSAFNPSQMLELETWEIAPGRIRCNEKNGAICNFAFSNAYLSQNQVVQIGRDISFQVITIKPGNNHSWEASPDKIRLCSLASGKLHVRMHGQQFSLGPNGMFKVQTGASCTATNRLYIDAMVHVAVVPGDVC
ncbi:hypothetical protein GGR53DRAFT_449964 [Hypoxylon sp. FL1150]|nr:hypothetical protein GGR53DRAFT_449964 [Hypoxylon sp. FL1150]